jgi:serine/threonine protein kinase
MNVSEPKDPRQGPESHGLEEGYPSSEGADRQGTSASNPAEAPTIMPLPASSGIGLALGHDTPVISEPEDFLHELTQSGLMEPAEAAAYRQRVSASGGQYDARAVSRELVRAGRLTPYQAAAILQGKAKGLLIGTYLVLDRLGAGGMGIVLKAEHRLLKRVVALKLLPPSLARDPSAVARFRREAKAAARLSHLNVVAVLDADEYRGLHFLVMEYVTGTDLARLVRDQGPVDVPRAIDCIMQAVLGLKATYEAGVVHRDIKPSNLLLEPGGTLKILDMGVARLGIQEGIEAPGAGATDATLTESNVLVGTVDYMAPEQAANPRLADHRSDIYSLGCTLYYLLTGRPPYSGESLIARILAHRENSIPSLSDVRPDVPDSLDRLFRQMLSKSPEDRVSSLDELITDLRACLSDTVAVRARESPPTSPAASTILAGRRRWMWLASAGVAAIAGLLGMAIVSARRGVEGVGTSSARIDMAAVPAGPTIEKANRGESQPSAQAISPPAPGPLEVAKRESKRRESDQPEVVESKVAAPGATSPEAARAVVDGPKPRIPAKAEAVGLIGEFQGHQGRVNAVAVSADGTRAVSGGQDGSIRLWDVAGAVPLLRLEHDGPVTCVRMTPDGLAGISGSLDRTVRAWDFRPERNLGMHRLEGHAGPVYAVAYGPDHRATFSSGGDKTVRLWDLPDGRPNGQPLLHESAVVALAVSTGGTALAGCEDGTIWQWDVKSRQRVHRLVAAGPVLCIAISPDGHRALSGHPEGILVLWNLDLGTEIGRMSAHGDYVRCVAFTPDGRRALAGSQHGFLVLWDIEGRRVRHRFHRPSEGSAPAGQMDIAIPADGLHALTAETDGAVRLWRLPALDDATTGLPDEPSVTR